MIPTRLMAMGRGGKRGPTARDYVRDGLVAMWDGIENAGWGASSNKKICIDLSGNGNDGIFWGDMTRGDNCFIVPRTDNTTTVRGALYATLDSTISAITKGVFTAELVMRTCPQNLYKYDSGYQKFIFIQGNLTVGLYVGGRIMSSPGGFQNAYMPWDTLVKITNKHVDTSNDIDIQYLLTENKILSKTLTATSLADNNIIGFTAGVPSSYSFAESGVKYHAFRLYSRALTADETAHNYAIDKERFNLP